MKRLSPNRDAMVARRRYKAIRKQGYPKRWPDEIAQEQGWRCFYCSRNMTRHDGPRTRTLDHKTPLSRGGQTRRANLVAACSQCNGAKGSMTAEEFAILRANEGEG